MPNKPSTENGLAPQGSQAGQRYFASVYDQHRSPRFPNGRPWWGSRELAANKGQLDAFCTSISPGEFVFSLTDPERGFPIQTDEDRLASLASSWSAPWLAPQNGGTPNSRNYYEFNYRLGRVQVRYDIIKRDFVEARAQYYRAANRICYEKGWPELNVGDRPRFAIIQILGDLRKEEDPRLPEACQAGDLWLLGSSDEVNEELAQVLGLSRQGLTVQAPALEPIATPKDVLNVSPTVLQEMIAAAIAQHEAGKRALNQQAMAKARAAKSAKRQTPAALSKSA